MNTACGFVNTNKNKKDSEQFKRIETKKGTEQSLFKSKTEQD